MNLHEGDPRHRNETLVQEECFIYTLFDQPLPKTPLPEEYIGPRREALWEAISMLAVPEIMVLDMRWGLSGDDIKNKTQTGKELGERLRNKPYVLERERQIEFKAIRKLRHPSRSGRISPYVELPEDALGRMVWGIDYGVQLATRYPHVDFNAMTLLDIDLSKMAVTELREQGVIPTITVPEDLVEMWGKLSGIPRPGVYSFRRETVKLSRIVRRSVPRLSQATQQELRNGVYDLEIS